MSKVLQLWAGMTGTVLPFAGFYPPSGWLLCYGQTVKRSDYPALFNVIGTMYGAGDGSTTFTLPDLRGRVPAGKDNMGGTAAGRLTTAGAGVDGETLGAAGGAQTHTLTAAQMPKHGHAITDPGHGHTVSDPGHTHGVSDPGHTHTTPAVSTSNGQGSAVGTANNHYTATTSRNTTGISINGAATGIGVNSAATGITVNTTGSDQAHNNTQPTTILNYIIKY